MVLGDPEGSQHSGKSMWSSGWLPAPYQGMELSSREGGPETAPGPAVHGVGEDELELLSRLNAEHARNHPRARGKSRQSATF